MLGRPHSSSYALAAFVGLLAIAPVLVGCSASSEVDTVDTAMLLPEKLGRWVMQGEA